MAAKKFTVFPSELELKAHCAQVHLTNAPRSRRNVPLPVTFITFHRPETAATQFRRGGGNFRGRGQIGAAGSGGGSDSSPARSRALERSSSPQQVPLTCSALCCHVR